jgi:16S rRNA G966 N2-methylase RsmD
MVYVLLIVIIILLICVCNNINKFIPLFLLASIGWYTLIKCDSFNNRFINGGNANQVRLVPYYKIIKHVNPEFVTRNIKTPMGNMTLIDEGCLIGGSKQRIMSMVLATIDEKKIIYAGPSTGYAQVALAYTCFMMGKQAILFLDCTKYDKSPLTDIAKKFGAVVNYFDPRIREKRLQYISKQADIWNKKNRDSFMLPFGLNDNNTVRLYSRVFQPLKKLNPKRLWVVAGSGLIFTSLSKIFTNTKFMIVQVGKKIWPDQLTGIDHQLFVSEYDFKENISGEVPYDTLLNYDAKVWPFILKHGKEGDFVWNTASSPKPWNIYDNEIHKIDNMKETFDLSKFMFTPKHTRSMPGVTQMFNALTDASSNWEHNKIVHRNYTRDYHILDGISNHFTEENRMNCIVKRAGVSPGQFLMNNKHKIAMKAAFLYNGQQDINKHLIDTVGGMYGYRECNSWNPLILTNFIKRYFKNYKDIDLLDPSMGWGDRLIACLSLGIKSYTGFDPNVKLHPCYDKITKLNISTKTKFYQDKFSRKKLTQKFDAVFTSPPFFDVEIYQYSEEDVAGSYDKWLRDMYIPYLNDMAKSVKDNGYVGVYIVNIGKFKVGDDTNRILGEQLTFVEELVLQNDYYDFNGLLHIGQPRSLWVYKKKIE